MPWGGIGLDGTIRAVDLKSMIVDEASLIQSLLSDHPVSRALLTAYAERQDSSPPGTWLDRIADPTEFGVEACEGEELSRLHGKLIALGLLDFEVSTKGTGVRYQVSTLGRTSLMRVCEAIEN